MFAEEKKMGFLLGSSTIFQSPFCKSLPPSFLTSSERKHGKKKMVIMAFMKPENPNDTNFITRRTFLLVGLSALPFLHSRASAVEGLMKGQFFFFFLSLILVTNSGPSCLSAGLMNWVWILLFPPFLAMCKRVSY